MPKPDPAAAKLKLLKALREGNPVGDAATLLRASLADRSNRVVERAAEIIEETADEAYIPELVQVYWRLKEEPLRDDPGCNGKTAALRALVKLEHLDAELFRDGIEYRQPEPTWNKSIDTAAELRGICAIGLINSVSRAEVLNRCAKLLVDEYPIARSWAARAIGALALPEGAAVLRLKLLVGDAEPDVLGECCSALLRLDRTEGVKFVLGLLAAKQGDLCVQAGLALGELRIAEAFAPLRSAWQRQIDPYLRRSLLICIALVRTGEAREFLCGLISREDPTAAADAIQALRVAEGSDEALKQRVAALVAATGDAQLNRMFADQWRTR